MKYVVLGGTGTLGRAVISLLMKEKDAEIVCFSRCELKQQDMARSGLFLANVSYRVGDIRDKDSIRRVINGADAVFHVAALKHVDVMEANPEESVNTNILGTINVADVAQELKIPHVVFSTTDKAVEPINIYGMSKAISERILFNRNKSGPTKFSVFRWGNVVGSRGSAIAGFVDAVKHGKRVQITHPEMTRFWIAIEDAATFMVNTYKSASTDKAEIPPIKSASVVKVVKSIERLLGITSPGYDFVGKRPGEKIHELLSPSYDVPFSSEWMQMIDSDLDELIRPFV